MGTVTAIIDHVSGRRTEFRVTPKGSGDVKDLPFRVLAPYAIISLTSGFVALAVKDLDIANGYYLLAALNAAIYGLVFTTILFAHWREHRINWTGVPWFARIGVAATLTLVPAMATAEHGLEMLNAVTWQSRPEIHRDQVLGRRSWHGRRHST